MYVLMVKIGNLCDIVVGILYFVLLVGCYVMGVEFVIDGGFIVC